MFSSEEFQNDLIDEVKSVKEKLDKKYNVKCSLDVSWSLSDLGFGEKKLKYTGSVFERN